MPKVVYDLTEAFVAATGKYPYYGIVRVVEAIGRELYLLDPDIQFGFFAHAFSKFYEVHPRIDPDTGLVDLNIPQNVKQIHHLRKRFYSPNRLRDALLPATHLAIRAINRRRWAQSGVELKEIDMEGAVLVSTGRPKHMVSALDALDQANVSYEFIPLLFDMFPLHNFSSDTSKSFPRHFIGDNARAIERAARIIAISEYTKLEIERFSAKGTLPPHPEIVAVPLVQECLPGTEDIEKPLPSGPYILTVGATIGRKNLESVFEAMLHAKENGMFVPRLALAGAPRKHVQSYLEQSRYDPIRDHIDIITNPNQSELIELYKNAIALVLPSRLEGWGLPAGEALWNGTPVICADIPVLHEVCGDLGLYVDPDNPVEIAETITRLHSDDGFAQTLRDDIARAAPQLRTWADVARDVQRVYNWSE